MRPLTLEFNLNLSLANPLTENKTRLSHAVENIAYITAFDERGVTKFMTLAMLKIPDDISETF